MLVKLVRDLVLCIVYGLLVDRYYNVLCLLVYICVELVYGVDLYSCMEYGVSSDLELRVRNLGSG